MMKAVSVIALIMSAFFMIAPALAQTGSITGMVTSANNAAVPDAVVTLWSIDSGSPVFVPMPNNPQLTSNFTTPLPGMYAFTDIPSGLYNVTAQWQDEWYFTTVDLTAGGTATANIVIPVYLNASDLATPTPQPSTVTYYTYVPVKISSPMPQVTSRSPGFEAIIVLIAIPIAVIAKRRLKK